jgi:hypothetical protein
MVKKCTAEEISAYTISSPQSSLGYVVKHMNVSTGDRVISGTLGADIVSMVFQ